MPGTASEFKRKPISRTPNSALAFTYSEHIRRRFNFSGWSMRQTLFYVQLEFTLVKLGGNTNALRFFIQHIKNIVPLIRANVVTIYNYGMLRHERRRLLNIQQ